MQRLGEDLLDYPDVENPRDNRLDDDDSIHSARIAFSAPNTAIQLEEGREDDAELLLEKVFAVGLLYKAIVSMPVRVDLDAPEGLEDVRTAKVNEMIYYLAQDTVDDTHQRLSSLAALLLLHILKLHGEGYVMNIPNRRRRSDRRMTAIQRLETLLSYLSDMKGLVLKCLQEREDGVAEVVAFPKTLFEEHLDGQVADSADEEEAHDLNDVDGQESAVVQAANPGSLGLSTQAQATTSTHSAQGVTTASTPAPGAPTTAPTIAAPIASQTINTPVGGRRRRVRPRMPSNF